jgi:hypothetical protein
LPEEGKKWLRYQQDVTEVQVELEGMQEAAKKGKPASLKDMQKLAGKLQQVQKMGGEVVQRLAKAGDAAQKKSAGEYLAIAARLEQELTKIQQDAAKKPEKPGEKK